MKIGIYGGSFDPVHFGHLILARDAVEELSLDRLIFVLAGRNPFKSDDTTPGELRLEMLRAAIADEPRMEIDDRELHRPPPSYTIETVQEIQAENPEAELFLMIGDDNVPKLDQWKSIDDLRELVKFVVLVRDDVDYEGTYPRLTRHVSISSTEIRERTAAGRSTRFLLPEDVRQIISQNGLYQK